MNLPRPVPSGLRALAPQTLLPSPSPLTLHPIPTGAGTSSAAQGAPTPQSGVIRAAVLLSPEGGQLQEVNVGTFLNSGPPQRTVTDGDVFKIPLPRNIGGRRIAQKTPVRYPVPSQVAGPVLRQRQPGLSMPSHIAPGQAQSIGRCAVQPPGGMNLATVRAASCAQPQAVQIPLANSHRGAPSQMSPDIAKRKCRNLLATLLRLAGDQPVRTAVNIRRLIQCLIDGTIEPEDFTTQLESELNSSPQPCLAPFLRNTLPYLRRSLLTGELSIEGVRPPRTPMSPPTTTARDSQKVVNSRSLLSHSTQFEFLAPGSLATQHENTRPHAMFAQQQRLATARAASTGAVRGAGKHILPANTTGFAPYPGAWLPFMGMPSGPTDRSVIANEKRAVVSHKIDDDINDVAAMGGVNLVEESQNIISSHAELEGAQARSCLDRNFLLTMPLQKRIADMAAKYGVDEIPGDVVALVSLATEERIRLLLEKLSVVAEHRQENVRADGHCVVTQDVRGQLKFLEEVDRLKARRHDEQEREMLFRAAKRRSRTGDSEQLTLRVKAKEMQKAEAEKRRRREADITALQAIGPRKRQSSGSPADPCAGSSSAIPMRPRSKRVKLRDVLFLLEQERGSRRSELLFRAYCK